MFRRPALAGVFALGVPAALVVAAPGRPRTPASVPYQPEGPSTVDGQ
jgi:hypothetical protein